jgi:hypothetical protein
MWESDGSTPGRNKEFIPISKRANRTWGLRTFFAGVDRVKGKRQLGRPRHRREDNIKINLRKVGCMVMGWIEMAQNRNKWRALWNAVINVWVPKNAGNFLTSWEPVSFSRRNLLHGVSIKDRQRPFTPVHGYSTCYPKDWLIGPLITLVIHVYPIKITL